MNSFLSIAIRVQSRQALAQLRGVQGQIRALQAQQAKANATAASSARINHLSSASMIKYGSAVQWAGRQLVYNFTLPLVAAGVFATKWALANEKATKRVTKVYGDLSMPVKQINHEVKTLGKTFETLSDIYAVSQSDTINIAADWAAAGASGVALGKAVELTMRTMVLGEMDATSATKDLISIQSQYGLTIEQLSKAIDVLNIVENQTAATMSDLIIVMSKSAGTARSAGVDIRELAALTAALVPASGSAATAGNALKTMFSRIISPTKQAAEIMKLMGINTESANWQALNGLQRLQALAKGYKDLSGAQKIQASTALAGRYQLNRFDTLMRDLTNVNGRFRKAMQASASVTRNHAQAQRELNTVLQSNPQKLKQIGVILQNSMARIIGPLVPLIIALATSIERLVTKFSNLDPHVQKLVVYGLALLALFGPILKYVGAFGVLIGYLVKSFEFAGSAVLFFGKGLLWLVTAPFKLVFGAIGFLIGELFTLGASELAPAKAMATLGAATVAAGTTFQTTAAAIAESTGVMEGSVATMAASITANITAASEAQAAAAAALVDETAAASVAMDEAWAAGLAAIDEETAAAGASMDEVWGAALGAVIDETAAAAGAMDELWAAAMGGLVEEVAAVAPVFDTVIADMFGAADAEAAAAAGVLDDVWAAGLAGLVEESVAAMTYTDKAFATGFAEAVLSMEAAMAEGTIVYDSALAEWVTSTAAAMATIDDIVGEGMALVDTEVVASVGLIDGVMAGLFAILTSPWTIAIGAVLALLYVFRDKLAGIWHSIVNFAIRMFNLLPQGIQSAMKAVVDTIANAARAVYNWFSYLNPFAKHSPSLVDTVTTGMKVVRDEHTQTSKHASVHMSRIASVHNAVNRTIPPPDAATSGGRGGGGKSSPVIGQATKDLTDFTKASKGLFPSEFAKQIKAIKDQFPSLLPLLTKLIADYRQLNALAAKQKAAVDAQTTVVTKWKGRLDAANATLKKQSDILQSQQHKLSSLQKQYDSAKTKMSNFANAPIKGMQKMNDAIFKNQMAQKRLQLQISDWEKANGSIDSLNDKLAKTQGQLEALRGQAKELQNAGAGSDVLGPINAQIDALQKSADGLKHTIDDSPVAEWQKQMDSLQTAGERLDLINQIKFDPIQHRIEKLAQAQRALSPKDIIAGIRHQRAVMDNLTPVINKQKKAVDEQTKVVDAAKRARDRIQKSYDRENAKLKRLTAAYNATAKAIQKVKAQLSAISAAAASAAASAGGGLDDTAKAFKAGAKGGFGDPGFKHKIGREGTAADQSKLIEKYTEGLQRRLAGSFGKFDLFKPFKDMWNSFKGWFSDHFGHMFDGVHFDMSHIRDSLQKGLSAIGHSSAWKGTVSIFKTIGGAIADSFRYIGKVIDLVTPDIKAVVQAIGGGLSRAFKMVGPWLGKFGDLLSPLGQLLHEIWVVAKPVIAVLLIGLVGSLKVLFSVLGKVAGPIINFFITRIDAVLKILHGLLSFILNILTGHWKKAWDGIKEIFAGVWEFMTNGVLTAVRIIKGVVLGLVEGVAGFFKWLYDNSIGKIASLVETVINFFKNLYNVLIGHSIIPDLVHGIVKLFKWLIAPVRLAFKLLWAGLKLVWNGIVKPLFKGMKLYIKLWAKIFEWIYDHIIKPAWHVIWAGIKAVWNSIVKPMWNGFKDYIKVWAQIFSTIWAGIKAAWHFIWAGIKTVWNNTGKPIWDAIKTVIHGLVEVFQKIKGPIKSAFSAIWGALGTVWDNLKSKIFQPVVDGLGLVVNGFIHAIDFIISGINKVSGLLHLGFHITPIGTWDVPTLAAGGRMAASQVGPGFVTNGPRAIVGEGGRHPEYVIPTDPRHRNRAQALWASLGKDISMFAKGGVMPADPGGGSGGPIPYSGSLGNIGAAQIAQSNADSVTSIVAYAASHAFDGNVLSEIVHWAGSMLEKLGRYAALALFKPIEFLAKKALDFIDIGWLKDAGYGILDKIEDWIKGKSSKGSTGKPDPSLTAFPSSVSRFTPEVVASLMDLGQAKNVKSLTPHVLRRMNQESGGNPNAINLTDSNALAGHPSKGLMQVIDGTYNAYKRLDSGNGVWFPLSNVSAGLNYAQHTYGSIQEAMDKTGGYVNGTRNAIGGLHWVGDGGPELLNVPAHSGIFNNSRTNGIVGKLTETIAKGSEADANGKTESKTTIININGPLVFPNIKTGDDSKKFIENLKIAAGNK